MSALTFTRQWLFNVNNLSHYVSGSALIQTQHSLYKIKNVLLGGTGKYGWTNQDGVAAAAPTFWVVDHSCDSTTAGSAGDGVDRWSAYNKIVWGSVAGANSWMVLKNASAITGKTFYLLLSCENSGSDPQTLDIWVSKVGFGAAHGGTNGTTTARPTATDEQNILVSTLWGGGNAAAIRFHVMMSSDGVATRLITTRYGGFGGIWLFEPMAGVVDGLEDDFLTMVVGSNGTLNWASLSQTPFPVTRTAGGTNVSGVVTAEGSRWLSNAHPVLGADKRSLWNDMAQKDQVQSLGIWGTSYPYRGHVGSLVDLWGGSDNVMAGQSFPGDFTRKLVTMGPLITPWNTTPAEFY